MTIINPDESGYPTLRGFCDTACRNPVTPSHSRRIVLGIVSQSLWCSSLTPELGGVPYTTKFPDHVFCGNPYDGLFYVAQDPWLGCSNTWAYDPNAGVQSFIGMMGDALYAKLGYPADVDIIIWHCGISGSAAVQWTPYAGPTGIMWPRLPWMLARAKAAGTPIQMMLCGQVEGECGAHANSDMVNGDPGLWVAHWQQIINSSRGIGDGGAQIAADGLAFYGKWLMPVYECWSTGDKVNTGFQAGIMPIISYPGMQWPNGDLDVINVGGRVSPGNGHLNYGGNLVAGVMVANAVWAALGPP